MTREEKFELISRCWHSNFTGTLKLCLLRLVYLIHQEKGYAYVKEETLAEQCSCCVRMVKYHIATLKAAGVLEVTLVKEKHFHNRYSINLDALMKHQNVLKVEPRSDPGPTHDDGGNRLPLMGAIQRKDGGNLLADGGNRLPSHGGNDIAQEGVMGLFVDVDHQVDKRLTSPAAGRTSTSSKSKNLSEQDDLRIRPKATPEPKPKPEPATSTTLNPACSVKEGEAIRNVSASAPCGVLDDVEDL